MGELQLIDRIRSGWSGAAHPPLERAAGTRAVVLGIGDDCAILRSPRGHEMLLTTDFSLEGRHFRRDWHSPESVGHRALARGLSDLAAMGGRPVAAFLSLALPPEMLGKKAGRAWIERFFQGMRSLAVRSGSPLAGGDTSESPCGLVLADIVLTGSAPAGRALRRSGGRPGDVLYVTGAIGGSAAELAAIASHPSLGLNTAGYSTGVSRARSTRKPEGHTASGSTPSFDHPHLFPEPRLQVGQALLRRRLASAAIDLSDGLSTDLSHLCRESGVGAEIDAASLPIHPIAAAHRTLDQARKLALHGGEDYELLFAAPDSVRIPRSLGGVSINRIGRLVPGDTVSLVEKDGRTRPLKPAGWEHFTVRK